MRAVPEIQDGVEARVEDLGYEVVDLRWGGSGRRPVLRLRIDREGSTPEAGVTVDDCASVSRALEEWLDGHEAIPDKYVLEVSSPGVERPLVRDRDYTRFRGEQVALKGKEVLHGKAYRLEGELLGLAGEGESQTVGLRLPNGDEVRVPRSKIRKAHLVFSWK